MNNYHVFLNALIDDALEEIDVSYLLGPWCKVHCKIIKRDYIEVIRKLLTNLQ